MMIVVQLSFITNWRDDVTVDFCDKLCFCNKCCLIQCFDTVMHIRHVNTVPLILNVLGPDLQKKP